nr:beta-galactosidase-1-like protein 2 [Meriones unguiculatus]
MWSILGRPACIVCLSSALSAMALLSHDHLPRLNQSHLTPLLMMTRRLGLKVEGSQFTLEGSPFRILSGTIDYFRVPRQSWRTSLRKMQACGFNTLTTHIPWNLHEPEVGQFHFIENMDLIAFITMASEVGLWVILCPGPYIGSDLDLGGLPSWLLRDPKMKLRTTYKGFTRAMNRYFDRLISRIGQYQYKRGGPIIAVQIENEYGSYYMDKKYMAYVKTDNKGPRWLMIYVSSDFQPQAIQMIAYEPLTLLYFMTLWEVLPRLAHPIKSVKPLSMEQLPVNNDNGQSFGYTLYETTIFHDGLLTSRGHIQDRGQVFLNKNYIGALDHSNDELSILRSNPKKSQILRILVENQGRLASGQDINNERKGITGDIYLDHFPLRKFTIYSLDMRDIFLQRKLPKSWKIVTNHVQGPAFFLSYLKAGDPSQDTFIKVKGWNKGVIFINGQVLGRYWNIGPQETLYVPGSWLHPGVNEIIIFEEVEGNTKISFAQEAQLGH